MMPGFEALWSAIEKAAQERMEKPELARKFQGLSLEMRSWVSSMNAVTNGIAFLEELGKRRWINVEEAAVGRHAIPNGEALDKILRYETAIDRQLGRTVDRLERLQKCFFTKRSQEVLNYITVYVLQTFAGSQVLTSLEASSTKSFVTATRSIGN